MLACPPTVLGNRAVMPLITVILPTCDRPALLPRAVASVLGQTERNFELLVIDNNRRQPALIEAAPFFGGVMESRVRIIRPAVMRNAATARNVGLAGARGKWVAYLDDDDAWRPEKLAHQLALARRLDAAMVLCGAEFHLRGRSRFVQCDTTEWRGDELLLRARWNTPLLFHRHDAAARFDDALGSGEDAEFAHRLLAAAEQAAVPNVAEPLVDIYPQPGPRVNTNPAPVRAAAARILRLRPRFYSSAARRRFVLHALLAVAKLTRRPGRCAQLSARLMRESRGADWRLCANAMAVSLNLFSDRWVS